MVSAGKTVPLLKSLLLRKQEVLNLTPGTRVKTSVGGGACLPAPGSAEEAETDRSLGPPDQLGELQAKEKMLSQKKCR